MIASAAAAWTMMNQERYRIQSRLNHSLCQNQSLRVAANQVLAIWNSRMATFIAMTLQTLRLRVDELPSAREQLYLHSNEIDTVSWNWTWFNVHSWALAHGYVSGSRSRQTMKYDIVSSFFSFFYLSAVRIHLNLSRATGKWCERKWLRFTFLLFCEQARGTHTDVSTTN